MKRKALASPAQFVQSSTPTMSSDLETDNEGKVDKDEKEKKAFLTENEKELLKEQERLKKENEELKIRLKCIEKMLKEPVEKLEKLSKFFQDLKDIEIKEQNEKMLMEIERLNKKNESDKENLKEGGVKKRTVSNPIETVETSWSCIFQDTVATWPEFSTLKEHHIYLKPIPGPPFKNPVDTSVLFYAVNHTCRFDGNLSREYFQHVRDGISPGIPIILLAMTLGTPPHAVPANSTLDTGERIVTLYFENGGFCHQFNLDGYKEILGILNLNKS